jgi:hypothetical protein
MNTSCIESSLFMAEANPHRLYIGILGDLIGQVEKRPVDDVFCHSMTRQNLAVCLQVSRGETVQPPTVVPSLGAILEDLSLDGEGDEAQKRERVLALLRVAREKLEAMGKTE